jgi:hypothetical protein
MILAMRIGRKDVAAPLVPFVEIDGVACLEGLDHIGEIALRGSLREDGRG